MLYLFAKRKKFAPVRVSHCFMLFALWLSLPHSVFVLFSWLNRYLFVPAIMFRNLPVDEWLGPARHPPRSLLRPILVLIDLRGLRPSSSFPIFGYGIHSRERVPWFFFLIDEDCFFTYAQYVEPFTSTAVTINDLRHALVHRILQTWGLHFRSAVLRIYINDHQDQEHILQGDDSLFQILGAYHPLGSVEVINVAIYLNGLHLSALMLFVSVVELDL